MNKRMSITDFVAALQAHIYDGTGVKCYDYAKDVAAPFYYVEVLGHSGDNDTKTMRGDVISCDIHCIAAPSTSSVGVYEMINELEGALFYDVVLPEPYVAPMSTCRLASIKTDETNEKHAIMSCSFTVNYDMLADKE